MVLNIILTTDFSEKAKNAMLWTTRFLADVQCTFQLLHAYSISPSSGENKSNTAEKLEILKRSLEQVASPKHSFGAIIEVELLDSLIKAVLKTEPIDLIVIGTKPMSQLRNTFFGSNAVDLVNNIGTCPILAIPENELQVDKIKLLLAYDFKEDIDKEKEARLKKLIEVRKLDLQVVSVVDNHVEPTTGQLENLSRFKKAFQGNNVTHLTILREGSITGSLLRFVQDQGNVAMVAFIRRPHGYFYHFSNEAVIKKETLSADFPLLAL